MSNVMLYPNILYYTWTETKFEFSKSESVNSADFGFRKIIKIRQHLNLNSVTSLVTGCAVAPALC